MIVRIAFVDHTSELGGAEFALVSLLNHLDRQRWDPLVSLGTTGRLSMLLESNGIDVQLIPFPAGLSGVRQGSITRRTIMNPKRLRLAVDYVLRLSKLARRQRVSLLHANSLRTCILAGLAGRIVGIPTVWQVHSLVAEPMMSKQGVQLMRLFARWLPQHIICNSAVTAAAFVSRPDALTVIPCGVDTARFTPKRLSGLRSNSRIGMLSRFSPIKGQHIFLDAVERVSGKYPKARFVVAGRSLFGEDEYEELMRSRGGAAGVEFPGFVDDVPGFLNDLDIVVHPSVEPEGFGQIIVEAMLCGKPVVVSAAGGSAELVEDGVTGRLVPPGNAQALAEAIDDLLADPAKAVEMGNRAREVAAERYDIRKTTKAIQDVYERVLARV